MCKCFLHLVIFLLFHTSYFYSQDSSTTYLSIETLDNNHRITLRDNWKYKSGDDANWSEPNYPDDDWEIADTRLIPENLPKSGWNGIGWFRLHLKIDSLYRNKILGLELWQTGASEIFLNGKRILNAGNVGVGSKERDSVAAVPIAVKLLKSKDNVIAVRYSNHSNDAEEALGFYFGFNLDIGNYKSILDNVAYYKRINTFYKVLFISIPITLAVLHFFMFFFNTKAKQNLFYSVFLIFFSIYIYTNFEFVNLTSMGNRLFFRGLMVLSLNLTLLFGGATIYSIYKKIPGYSIILLLAALIISIPAFLNVGVVVWHMSFFFIVVVSIAGSAPLFSSKYYTEGEIIIKSGYVILIITGVYQILMSYGIVGSILGINTVYIFGVIIYLFFMSIYLAKSYALTSKSLEKQLVQVKELSQRTLNQELTAKELETEKKILESENKRKSQELEDARSLQLSMLPSKLPDLPELDIAVFMKTATEVGGDYYDFDISKDGTLNVVIGDATGHGMKAGLMVATIKSLFTAMGNSFIITDFLEKCTITIKNMKLGNLFMSLCFLKIKDGQILYCSAGMPPIFIYKSKLKKLEKLVIKSMPLGAVKGFPYEINQFELAENDFIVLMSDGLPERFNKESKMLGYNEIFKRIKNMPKDCTAKQILNDLYKLSDEWADGKLLEDDLTLLVIKRLPKS